MALLQNIIDTEVSAKRYAESKALIKEPFEVCPPNRVAAMHRTVALQESLRAEGALRDHTARNLSYYGPSGAGQTPSLFPEHPDCSRPWEPSALSSREALMSAYHTYPFYQRFWNDDDFLSRQYTPELWQQQMKQVATGGSDELATRAMPEVTERNSTNQGKRQEANAKFEAGVAGYAHLVAQRQAEMDANIATNAGMQMGYPGHMGYGYAFAAPYGMQGYHPAYLNPHMSPYEEALSQSVATEKHDEAAAEPAAAPAE